MIERCLECQPCQAWQKQRAAYAAALSEAHDDPSKVEALQASWNALQSDPSFECENPSYVPPVGSDIDNLLKGTRNPILRPGPCLVRCQIVFPDPVTGNYPQSPGDDQAVDLSCDDAVQAAGLLDEIVARFNEKVL